MQYLTHNLKEQRSTLVALLVKMFDLLLLVDWSLRLNLMGTIDFFKAKSFVLFFLSYVKTRYASMIAGNMHTGYPSPTLIRAGQHQLNTQRTCMDYQGTNATSKVVVYGPLCRYLEIQRPSNWQVKFHGARKRQLSSPYSLVIARL